VAPVPGTASRNSRIDAEWGASENNRRAKFYSLTRSGRKRLADEATQWERLSAAIAQVMTPGS